MVCPIRYGEKEAWTFCISFSIVLASLTHPQTSNNYFYTLAKFISLPIYTYPWIECLQDQVERGGDTPRASPLGCMREANQGAGEASVYVDV
jgi:hypothetical protein